MSNIANPVLGVPGPRHSDEGLGKKSNEKPVLEHPVNGDVKESPTVLIRPQTRPLHDTSITFEEYNYYAKKTRAEEEEHLGDIQGTRGWAEMVFPSKSGMGASNVSSAEKHGEEINATMDLSDPEKRANISDQEWTNASRALRTATKSAIFYLITTDILGPFALPFAFATMGWG